MVLILRLRIVHSVFVNRIAFGSCLIMPEGTI